MKSLQLSLTTKQKKRRKLEIILFPIIHRFPSWNEEDVPCVSSLLNSPTKGRVPLGIYYHIPFCRKRCHFCYFKVYTDKNSADVRNYLDSTIKELETYAESSYIKGENLNSFILEEAHPHIFQLSNLLT